MRNAWPTVASLNVAQQLAALKHLYPEGTGRLGPGSLVWEMMIQPSVFSRPYQARIEYRQEHIPGTRITDPNLRLLAGDRKIPHLYNQVGDPLCLFYVPAREWNSSMPIAKTIVPWSCEWLFHFEAWLHSGEWDGGGIHQSVNQSAFARVP
jgi:hypothetical protein